VKQVTLPAFSDCRIGHADGPDRADLGFFCKNILLLLSPLFGQAGSGPRSKMDLEDDYNGLADRTLHRSFGPREAVYRDRYV
jgi:hypothetical protein